MQKYNIPSHFKNTTISLYWYPSKNKSRKAVVLLKGLYGEHKHDQVNTSNRDIEVIRDLNNDNNILAIHTGRLPNKKGADAFIGKTFKQECTDVLSAFTYCIERLNGGSMKWAAIGSSFGGTTLLGSPEVLAKMDTVIFIGSGSGKSKTTTKPLLSTLPDTEHLLAPIKNFNGNVFFLHGSLDKIVPLHSQKEIYKNVSNSARHCEWIECLELDHKLINVRTGKSELSTHVSKLIKQFL